MHLAAIIIQYKIRTSRLNAHFSHPPCYSIVSIMFCLYVIYGERYARGNEPNKIYIYIYFKLAYTLWKWNGGHRTLNKLFTCGFRPDSFSLLLIVTGKFVHRIRWILSIIYLILSIRTVQEWESISLIRNDIRLMEIKRQSFKTLLYLSF